MQIIKKQKLKLIKTWIKQTTSKHDVLNGKFENEGVADCRYFFGKNCL